MKANFYTKKPTVTTLTVEKITAKTAQVTNKRNLKQFRLIHPTIKVSSQMSPKFS